MIKVVSCAPRGAGAWEARVNAVARWGIRALLACLVVPAAAADLAVTPANFSTQIGAAQLAAGAGSNFESPVVSDVLLATLTISNTGGANWQLEIALDGGEADLPAGVSLSLRRAGGAGEAGISGGLGYQALTGSPETFFNGSGDYASVEILLQIDGITAAVPPAQYTPNLRYTIVVP